MAAPRISPYPIPSFKHWRFNLPRMSLHDQHKGVYYATAMAPHSLREVQLNEKQRIVAAEQAFRSRRELLLTQFQRKFGQASALTASTDATRQALAQCADLYSAGLHDVAGPSVDALVQHGLVDSLSFANLLESLSAPTVLQMLLETDCNFDVPLAMKKAADWSGYSRAREAALLLEKVPATGNTVTTQHFNGLMSAYLTCGFTEASRVHSSVYDAMGAAKVQPNAETYLRLMQSLCLTGNPAEAHSIFAYLKQHHADVLTPAMYETMMWGWILEKDFQRVDEVWTEAVDRRYPQPSAKLAETYVRSILILANARVSETGKQFGEYNQVERKRIPIILHQMDGLGLNYNDMCPMILFEANNALRQFTISKRRFYEWGRAVKQFDFLDYRRRAGVIHDLREINPTVITGAPANLNDKDKTAAPASGAELPGDMDLRPSWERLALPEAMLDQRTEEINGKTNDKYIWKSDAVHDRPATWMFDTPQTRYDKLYGVSRPNLAKLGIRRHLYGDHPDKAEILAKDQRLVSNSMAAARRVRSSVERTRTHRDE